MENTDLSGAPANDARVRSKTTTACVIVVGALVVLAMWAVVVTSIRHTRERAMDHARSETHNLAAAFADEVSRNLDSVAASMAIVARRLQAGENPHQLAAWAKDIPMLSGATIQAAVIGPD